jgi:hypothetical protein
MFHAAVYHPDWADTQRRSLGNCDPNLLEKSVYALTLLGKLAETGVPFMFKGGTSLLLHLPSIRRLSIDIDIVCAIPNEDLDRIVEAIGKSSPFVGMEESIRGETTAREPLPHRRHFKFQFNTHRAPGGVATVLLDVVQEAELPHQTVTMPIRTAFLNPEREVLVTVPTIESLLGDKLTAFAPTTIGVPLQKLDGTEGDTMQIAKQLFDVGILFDHASDFAQVARVYDAVYAQEAGYRGNRHSRADTLNDTFLASLGLCPMRERDRAAFPHVARLTDGFRRLKGHLAWPGFSDRDIQTLAARGVFLAAYLRAGASFEFPAIRFTNTAEQFAALQAAPAIVGNYAWVERVKGTNAEAYHYLHRALSI